MDNATLTIDDKINTSWMETIMRYSNGDVHLCGVLLDAIWLIELKKKVHFKFLRQTIQLECIMQLSGGKHLEHALQTLKKLQFVCFLKVCVHLLVKEIGTHSLMLMLRDWFMYIQIIVSLEELGKGDLKVSLKS